MILLAMLGGTLSDQLDFLFGRRKGDALITDLKRIEEAVLIAILLGGGLVWPWRKARSHAQGSPGIEGGRLS